MSQIRVRPVVLRDLMDDVAVEIDLERRRRGLTVAGICRSVGWVSKARHGDVCRYLRGDDHRLGIGAICRLADHLKIPIQVDVGTPRPLPQIAAPTIVPALAELSQVPA